MSGMGTSPRDDERDDLADTTVLRATLVSGGMVIPDAVVETAGDRLVYAGPAAGYSGATIARQDLLVMPGLIDVHCHGGGGAGFPDGGSSAAATAIAFHRRMGTTSMLGSLVSAAPDTLLDRIATLSPLVRAGELGGIHLEGPFIARSRCGAQDPRYIIDADPGLLRDLLAAGGGAIRSMTIAPETSHFAEAAQILIDHDVVVSLGHSSADHATARRALDACIGGTVSATHLFNGMEPMHHRSPGLVAACLAAAGRGELVVELVSDAVHLDPATVAMVFDTVGPDQIALVSDAMAAAGMPDGHYRLGPAQVTVDRGIAHLSDSGDRPVIAGGTSVMLDLVRTAVGGGVDVAAAVASATRTPARLVGMSDRGVLAAGMRADLVVTGPDLGLRHVMRDGKWVQ
ncbi:amidohydrolase family protein [Gordonia jinhuaensis]